jgi:hypothetical protein
MTIIPASYGPGLELIRFLKGKEEICIGAGMPYQKGTNLSRMRILSASGPLLLSIPVRKFAKNSPLSDIRIDYLQKWQNQHWRSLFSAYGKSPYFDYFKEELETLYAQRCEHLAVFNSEILSWTLKQYFPKMKIQVNLSAGQESLLAEAATSLPPESENGVLKPDFRYRQVFGSEFVTGLSALDHLFCAGPKSIWNLPS